MQQDNNFQAGIGMGLDNLTAQFATKDVEGQVFRAFPEQLHVLESFDQLTYDQVYDHLFSDKFFDLTPAMLDDGLMEAANQRTVYQTEEGDVRVVITLPGRMLPNEKLRLFTNAVAAGYTLEPIKLIGEGCAMYSQFTISKDL